MITTHFINPWADWQLQIQRHSAGPASRAENPPARAESELNRTDYCLSIEAYLL